MKYIRDETGDLVNIALAQYISVAPIEEATEDSSTTHCVLVIFPNEDSTWLYSGSEGECKDFLAGVWAKLEREQM